MAGKSRSTSNAPEASGSSSSSSPTKVTQISTAAKAESTSSSSPKSPRSPFSSVPSFHLPSRRAKQPAKEEKATKSISRRHTDESFSPAPLPKSPTRRSDPNDLSDEELGDEEAVDDDNDDDDELSSPRRLLKSPTASMGGERGHMRTSSSEAHKNVYTDCGRHGDDWLFGGFSATDSIKKLWEKKH